MEIKIVQTLLCVLAFIICGSASAADYGGYSGSGGMSAESIPSNVYEYHYDKGFTGVDAAGWDPNLQYAWSRIAAATICKVDVSVAALVPKLIKKFGQNTFTHKVVGIGFHEAQIRANQKFCTANRVAELKKAIPKFSEGRFPKKY